MDNNHEIPNAFTPCETYRGSIIAVREGWYHAFRKGRKGMERVGYTSASRAGLRVQLDTAFPLDL